MEKSVGYIFLIASFIIFLILSLRIFFYFHRPNNKVLYFMAVSGHIVAQYNLGVRYENGIDIEQNINEALKWYNRADAKGYAAAQYNLGVLYANGKGVEQNFNEALKWYQLSAKQGNALAQYNLGVLYANGKGIEQNFNEAIRWFELSIEQGNDNARNALKQLNQKNH